MTLLERWRRWRRWRRLRSRRWYGGEFGMMVRIADDHLANWNRRAWRTLLQAERARADAEHRRRMRGGYEIQGLP